MRILLLGDYSNLHATLAEGLKALGHECVVASDGDHWKNYPRDIDLRRDLSLWGTMSFMARLLWNLPRMRGYDIVQLVNPVFVELRAERILPFYKFLRRHNRKIVLGAFGLDYYWAKVNRDIRPLRYSDFNIGDEVRRDEASQVFLDEWIGTAKEELTKAIAKDCDWIVPTLYEYYETYKNVSELKGKITFIPEPIKVESGKLKAESGKWKAESCLAESGKWKAESCLAESGKQNTENNGKVRLFVGISKNRSAYKGTDIMLRAAQDVQSKYPDLLDIQIAEGVPFAEYQKMMDESDAILDQLYSYTPSMNSLLAMSKGIIDIGGGEPENYDILGEKELRPIINVEPNYESCYREIEQLVLHPERIPLLKQQSVEYVRRHHDYMKVAREYEALYKKLLSEE